MKYITLAFVFLFLIACDKYKVNVASNGAKYQILSKGSSGKKINFGDFVSINLIVRTDKDTVLKNTYRDKVPIEMILNRGVFKGSFEDGIANLMEGDSAVLYVPSDSLVKIAGTLPPSISKGSDIRFFVKVNSVKTREELDKKNAQQLENESKVIEKYTLDQKWKQPQKSERGVFYTVTKAGMGKKMQKGDSISVKYVGRFMDGKEFDKNNTTGISLVLGRGMVIPGWEEGLLKLKEGDKATLIIPSGLAYGSQGAGNAIPPNTPLVFDVEIMKVHKK